VFPEPVLLGVYDLRVVALSIVIGVLGGYAGLDLGERAIAARGRARLAWRLGSAAALGIGIWAMHYTAMLAFHLPVRTYYDWPTAALSLLVALGGSLPALFVVTGPRGGLRASILGGLFQGGGIAGLHYTAMASMRVTATHHYASPIVLLSVIVAIVLSLASFSLVSQDRQSSHRWKIRKTAGILLMGAAISGMHYTGMAAVTFTRSAVVPDLSYAVSISLLDTAGFSVVAVMVLTVALVTSLADRYREQRGQLENFSQRLIESQEAERRRVARDLHDDGQILTGIKLNLVNIQREAGPSPLARRLDESIAIIDGAIERTRELALALRPSLLDDLGLVAALQWYVDREARRAGLTPEIVVDLRDARLSPEVETACFRIVQEALTNVVRHSGARHVWIELRQRGSALHLSIRDDGVGFDVRTASSRRPSDVNLGLQGMRERASIVGGHLEIESTPGHGTEVRARLPDRERA
jgi:signal transduction histidine kinase